MKRDVKAAAKVSPPVRPGVLAYRSAKSDKRNSKLGPSLVFLNWLAVIGTIAIVLGAIVWNREHGLSDFALVWSLRASIMCAFLGIVLATASLFVCSRQMLRIPGFILAIISAVGLLLNIGIFVLLCWVWKQAPPYAKWL
jgi:hypothetical protein